jgi:hypothetical protein
MVAFLIVWHLVSMLAAVQFDDELMFQADKIRDEISDQELSSEFISRESAVAHQPPESLFRICGDVAHFTRMGTLSVFYLARCCGVSADHASPSP